ncbi:hypothetical protein ACQ86N_05115 [Puia sp. P3]|uniref:hypothetical protein n=1 Tax=Puia sp. P3 TaxID=3423952 RepID=UPI003D674C38
MVELVIGDRVEAPERRRPEFIVSGVRLASSRVRPGQVNMVKFFIENKGVEGVRVLRLFVGGRVVGSVNCLAGTGMRIEDSIRFRWYPKGEFRVCLDSAGAGVLTVAPEPGVPLPSAPEVQELDMRAVFRIGDSVRLSFVAQNVGWNPGSFRVPVMVDGKPVAVDTMRLGAGERSSRRMSWRVGSRGWHQLWVGNSRRRFRVYDSAASALVLDLDGGWKDRSGFGNNGVVSDGLVRLPGSYSLNDLGRRLTMLLWVYPEKSGRGLTDIFTNGDNHVLQVVDGRQPTFFAGGWGRGTAPSTCRPTGRGTGI